MQSKHSQSGFTLIELVVVIVILGILAAVALPKFMGLSQEARLSVINGTAGSVTEAADMVHALAEMQGQTTSTGTVTLPNGTGTIAVTYGYPSPTASGIGAALQGYSSTPTANFPFSLETTPGAVEFAYAPSGQNPNINCGVTYTQAGNQVADTVTTVTSGC